MRPAILATALGFACLGIPSAPAAPSTPAFADANLRAELVLRIENDFGGTLSPTQKKQRKALLKCVALIDRPTTGGMKDLKTFVAVAKSLEKAFSIELGAKLDSDFYLTIIYAYANNSGEYSQDHYDLFSAVGKLAPSPWATKAARYLDAADAAMNDSILAGTLTALGKATIKSWKLVLKGIAAAAGGEILPAPSVDFTVDGLALSTSVVYWTYHSVSQRVVLSTSATDPATGDYHNLVIDTAVTPVTLVSDLLGGNYVHHTEAVGDESFAVTAGTTVVTALDPVGRLFEGSFDFTTDGGHAVSGTFHATWNFTVVED